MKKKIFATVTAVIMALMCVLGLVACSDDGIEGTYYMYSEKVTLLTCYVKLEDGQATIKMFGDSKSGTYKVDDKTLSIDMGNDSTYEFTLVSDGILKDSEGVYYCKMGYKLPKDEESTETED